MRLLLPMFAADLTFQLTSLVPSLDRGSDTVQYDSEVQRLWVSPAVSDLHQDIGTFTILEPINLVQIARVLGQQCALLEKWKNIHQVVVSRELFNVCEELRLGYPDERIADSSDFSDNMI